MKLSDLAKLAYESYCSRVGNLNYMGLDCPTWDNLPAQTRQAWQVAVKAVYDKLLQLIQNPVTYD